MGGLWLKKKWEIFSFWEPFSMFSDISLGLLGQA
jgi:hypothetical protein